MNVAAAANVTASSAQAVHARLRGETRVFTGKLSVHALGPLDLDLQRGEFFSVVGPSGCGKSTLMDLIAGLSPPTEGTIAFEDKPVAGEVPDGIGAVFQEDASFPWLTVRDNIAASSSAWVIRRMVPPVRRHSRNTSSPMSSLVWASRAPNGSSSRMRRGCSTSVRAMQTRWRMPPESCAG